MRKTFAQLSPFQQRATMQVLRGFDDHTLDRIVLEEGSHWPRHLMGKCGDAESGWAIGGPCPLCRDGVPTA